jgi:hypothetical protein
MLEQLVSTARLCAAQVYACWSGFRRRDGPDCEACHKDAVMQDTARCN